MSAYDEFSLWGLGRILDQDAGLPELETVPAGTQPFLGDGVPLEVADDLELMLGFHPGALSQKLSPTQGS